MDNILGDNCLISFGYNRSEFNLLLIFYLPAFIKLVSSWTHAHTHHTYTFYFKGKTTNQSDYVN